MSAAELGSVPSFTTGATFFDGNSQAHHKPLSAFGDLTDNARESDARHLSIEVQEGAVRPTQFMLTLTDDGVGMSEYKLRYGMGGIAHSDKSHRAETHYGIGAKSALPRLSANSLVFSKTRRSRTVVLISTTFSRSVNSHELKVCARQWAGSAARALALRPRVLATSSPATPASPAYPLPSSPTPLAAAAVVA